MFDDDLYLECLIESCINESSLTRLMSHASNYDTAIITAFKQTDENDEKLVEFCKNSFGEKNVLIFT